MSDLDSEVKRLEKFQSQKEVLDKAYKIITARYYGQRLTTYLRLFDLFGSDIEKLWRHNGFMHCTKQNRLLTYLLVSSGRFSTADIKPKWTLYWGVSPHQYLEVRVGSEWVKVDPWSAVYGIKLGDYSHWFHTKSGVGI